jgi:hypothetical protein
MTLLDFLQIIGAAIFLSGIITFLAAVIYVSYQYNKYKYEWLDK